MLAIMSLTALPTDVQIEIAGHLATTLNRNMDNLHNLWVTCSSIYHICGNPTISRCLSLDWVRRGRMGANPVNYYTLLASLTQVSNLEACFLTRIQTVFMEKHSPCPCLDDLARATDGEHNLAAYLVTLLLYRHNGDVSDKNTVR